MQSQVQEIKAIRDRILQVANNVCNYRLDNIEYEFHAIFTYLSELSYHDDLTECMNLCRDALQLIRRQLLSSILRVCVCLAISHLVAGNSLR